MGAEKSELREPKPRLLLDEPAEKDWFESGGHDRSAAGLSEAILQLIDKDGAIGLQGEWGSGKSTVINIASQKLKLRDSEGIRHRVFSFDLWSHQSDDFRRAFLEELLFWSQQEKLLTPKTHDQFLDKIRDRVKEITYKNEKSYNVFGILFILIAPLLPLAYTWLSPFAFSKEFISNGLFLPHFVFIAIGIAIYSAFFARVVWYLLPDGDNRKTKNVFAAISKAASLFTRDVDKEVVTQNIREEDPTTFEFQSIFRDILSTAQSKGDRIIAVIDNIDRLPVDRLRDTWGEVRSIFSSKPSTYTSRNATVTVVIPYDEKYVSRSLADGQDHNNIKGLHPQTRDLVQKTFSTVIKVSPPLSADWKKFFEFKLDEVFHCAVPDVAKYRLFKLLDIHLQKNLRYPTPRTVISYVNDIAVLRSQWGNLIPWESLALYVLHRSEIDSSPERLRDPLVIETRFLNVANVSEWRRDLAALVFNVEPERANQVLLGQNITRALAEGRQEEIRELAALGGFFEALPDVVENNGEDWARESANTFSNVGRCLSIDIISGEPANHVWRIMGDLTRRLAIANLDNLANYQGIFETVSHQNSDAVLRVGDRLITWFGAALDPEEKERSHADGLKWMTFVNEVYAAVKKVNGVKNAAKFISRIKIPMGVSLNLGVAEYCSVSDGPAFDQLQCTHPTPLIRGRLRELIKEDVSAFAKIVSGGGKLFDDPTITASYGNGIQRLQSEKLDSDNQRTDLVTSLCLLRDMSKKRDSIDEQTQIVITDGSIAWHHQQAIEAQDIETSSNLKWLLIETHDGEVFPTTAQPAHPQFGEINDAIGAFNKIVQEGQLKEPEIKAIVNRVIAAGSFSKWHAFAREQVTYEVFFQKVFRELVRDGQYNILIVDDAISNYDKTRQILGEELSEQFLKKYSNWSRHFQEEFGGKKCLAIPSALLLDIDHFGIDELSPLLDCIDLYLNSLSSEDWLELFTDEDDGLEILIARAKTAGWLPPVSDFRPALFSHACEVLRGDAQLTRYANDWSEIIKALSPPTRSKLARDVLQELEQINVTSAGVFHFFDAYGVLAGHLPIQDRPDTALDNLIIPLIAESTDQTHDFLSANKSEIRQCIKDASEGTSGRLVETIQGLEDKHTEEFDQWAAFLRDIFDMKKVEILPSNGPDDADSAVEPDSDDG